MNKNYRSLAINASLPNGLGLGLGRADQVLGLQLHQPLAGEAEHFRAASR